MSLYSSSIPQLTKKLRNILNWLDKAEVHAKARNFDVNGLLAARLAPDMYPLVRQIQSCCDTAKFTAARLAAKEAPRHPDTEQTVEQLRARILSTVEYLATFQESDFLGAEERKLALPYLPEDKRLLGADYLIQSALPNFYFHLCMTYAILRHNGVDVGKVDYMGGLPLVDA
jgi:hypothetical protein